MLIKETPLLKIKELCSHFNLPNLLVKDESKNPFGTHKDRRSEFIVKKAVENNVNKLVLITAGNAGYSLGKFCEGTRIKLVNVVDKNLSESIKKSLASCSVVVEKDLSAKISSAELVELVREHHDEIVWNVCTGFFEAYDCLLSELKNPDTIIVPVGSGNLFVSLYNSIKKRKLMTKLVGVTSKNKFDSFADKLANPHLAYKTEIKEMLNEGHRLIKLSEDEIKSAFDEFIGKEVDFRNVLSFPILTEFNFCYPIIKLRHYKDFFVCEPSSTVVFAALKKLKLNMKENVVVINSGRGVV